MTSECRRTSKAIIDELTRRGHSTVWVSDHHLVQTHTCALQALMEDAETKAELHLKGFYSTTSEGTDKASPNCFMFPLPNGAFKVYRFSPGVSEANTWQQDGEGWTTCFFNHEPDLKTASRALGGAELADNKGYQFKQANNAIEVAKALGQDVQMEDKFLHREAVLRPNKDGRLVARVKKTEDEPGPDSSWAKVRGGWWEKVFAVKADPNEHDDYTDLDNHLRATVTPDGQFAGFYTRSEQRTWDYHPKANVSCRGCPFDS